ncbi:MAG: hypothetical protein O2923_11050 [Verrucomicrobia bacterium]|nr:hypothetical protein [Verrucomicrobiota bacterium]
MKSALKHLVVGISRRCPPVRTLAEVIVRNNALTPDTYGYLRARFIENGDNHEVDRSTRKALVEKFERIDREVAIGTSPTDGLFLAEILLNLDAEGVLVECGCFAGGSSSKISLIASILGRTLLIFDSFEGLPEVEAEYLRDSHCRRNEEWQLDWTPGKFKGSLELVRANIQMHGSLEACDFIQGWFEETLTADRLPEQIAFAFADVDLANSSTCCFTSLWPRLSSRAVYATHDAAYLKVLQVFYNSGLWSNGRGSTPPILFGAGFGLCNESPHLGYMVKGEDVSVEYLKGLTIDK